MSKIILMANESTIENYKMAKLESELYGSASIGNVGIVSIYGALGLGFWDSPISYGEIQARIEEYVNDTNINAIVLDINSPGGAVAGLFDTCSYIKNISKPTIAYIDGEACSSAYAIASSCSKVFASDGSITACCGAYAHVIEESDEAYKKEGLLHRIFRSSNAPKKNLSIVEDEETAQEFQKEVDAQGEKYLSLVMENRGIDDALTFGEGREMLVEEALKKGLIDGICSLDGAIKTISPTMDEEINMDISKLSEEEKRELLDELLKDNPDILKEKEEEGKCKERERIAGLNSLRNGIDDVEKEIDNAIENGKTVNDIIGCCYSLTSGHKKASLETLVSATTEVNTPSVAVSEKEELDKFFKAVKEMK